MLELTELFSISSHCKNLVCVLLLYFRVTEYRNVNLNICKKYLFEMVPSSEIRPDHIIMIRTIYFKLIAPLEDCVS